MGLGFGLEPEFAPGTRSDETMRGRLRNGHRLEKGAARAEKTAHVRSFFRRTTAVLKMLVLW